MFDELRTFMTVVEYKNFTKAGEVLHLSQPSVSAHVKNLENRFQTILIHRSVKQKSIIITESGERLYQYAKEVLQLTEQVSMDISDNTPAIKGHLRIGASLTMGEYILPAFLAHFCEKYPDIEVEVCIDNTAVIAEQVKSLSLDIGLVEGSTTSAHFVQEYILEDHLVLALPYKKEGIQEASSEYLKSVKWIIREDGSGTKEYMDLFFSTHEITPKQIMTMGSNHAIIESVKHGLGITIMSHIVAKGPAQKHEIMIMPLEETFNRHYSYIIPKVISPSHTTECFISEFKNYTAHLHLH